MPDEENSPIYELMVSYFSTGTPEEPLLWKRDVFQVIAGQNITNIPAKYALVHRLLQGDVLAAFNHAALAHSDMTQDHFKI